MVRGFRKKSYTYDITRCKFLYLGGARMYQKVSANKAYKKIAYQNFQFFQPLKITFMCSCNFCRYEHVSRNFRTLLEENCAIAFDSCHLFTKKILNIKLNMILIVLMEFTYIKKTFLNFTASLMNTLQFTQMMNLTVC